MSALVSLSANAALIVLVLLLIPCIYRLWIGPSAADRLQVSDTITTLLIAIIVLLALVRGDRMYVDVGIALAAFGFIGTLALARYMGEAAVLTEILDLVGLVFLWIGVGFSVIGILGLLRLPDMYTRLHATGKISTVGLCSILLGAACLMPSLALKLIALAIFAVLTMPVSTHVIAAAGYRGGVPMAQFSRDDLAKHETAAQDEMPARDGESASLEETLQHRDRLV